jgi:hypothetical protein
MSVKKIRPGQGVPAIVVRKGRPLTTSYCPTGCGGTLTDTTNTKGEKIKQCSRCRSEVTSKPF